MLIETFTPPRYVAPHLYILGEYKDTVYNEDVIEGVLKHLLGEHNMYPGFATVRSPASNARVRDQFASHSNPQANSWKIGDPFNTGRENWHDGWHHDYASGHDEGMVLWASSEPTEFLIDGKIVRVSPGDVALAHNLFMEHRIPPVIGADRWFCRIPILAPAWLEKDVDNVSGILKDQCRRKHLMRVRVNCEYIYYPNMLDRIDGRAGLVWGSIVKVVNLPGCPRANTMNHCHVEFEGRFAGLVHVNSLHCLSDAQKVIDTINHYLEEKAGQD